MSFVPFAFVVSLIVTVQPVHTKSPYSPCSGYDGSRVALSGYSQQVLSKV